MLKVFAEPARPTLPAVPHPVLALGFRPFFLLAAAVAVLDMGGWLAMWAHGAAFGNRYGLVPWHAHEMLFGYSAAVLAGFLLTAVSGPVPSCGSSTAASPGSSSALP